MVSTTDATIVTKDAFNVDVVRGDDEGRRERIFSETGLVSEITRMFTRLTRREGEDGRKIDLSSSDLLLLVMDETLATPESCRHDVGTMKVS